MINMITATGIGSGLDISGLVSQLVAAERAGSDLQLNRQTLKLESKFSALGSMKSSLSSFQASLNSLSSVSTFKKKSVTSSNPEVLSVSADNKAVPNDYNIDVVQLAGSHSLASAAYADTDTTAIGSGTMTIRFGTTDYDEGTDTYNSFTLNPESETANITIDNTNNTLDGIMNAINDADIDVKASIVNDGTGFRLLLTSENTGIENSLEISVSDDDTNDTDTSGLSGFAFNASATNLEQTAQAQDAIFSINGLTVQSADNEVTEAIPGVTMSLYDITAFPESISVVEDTDAVISAVESFVSGFNGFMSTVNSTTNYDAENDVAGVLIGDFTVRSIKSQVESIIYNPVSGLTGDFKSMSELGLTTNDEGNLELDSSQFKEILASNPDDVLKIFSAFGTASDNNVEYLSSTSKTATGIYNVDVTSFATKGYLQGNSVLPDFASGGTVTINNDNNNFLLSVNSVDTGEVTLTPGTYTDGNDLAAEIQTQINGSPDLKKGGVTVTVAYSAVNNSFTITSDEPGSNSTVNMLTVDPNTASELGFGVVNGIDGNDIVGTINGQTAQGIGNVLTAEEGSDAEGLSLVIGGTTTGSRGQVDFTRGLASQLELLLKQILDEEGALEDRLDGIQDQLDDIELRKETLELRWDAVEARYLSQFNALDSLLASFETTSSFLSQQLGNFPGAYKPSGNR